MGVKIQQTTVKTKLTMVKTRRTPPTTTLPMMMMRRRLKTPITRRRTMRTRTILTTRTRMTLKMTTPMTMKRRMMGTRMTLTMRTKRTTPTTRTRKMTPPMIMRRTTPPMITRRTILPTMRMRKMRERTPRERTLMRMRMKMQKMTNVNGRTGASGLADAARSLADALEFKLEAGPLTISCLTRAAVDSSVQDGKLKLGPAKKKIVAKMPTIMRMSRRRQMKMQKMTNVNGKTGASGLVIAAHSLADVLAVRLVPGLQTTSCLTPAAADSSVPDGKLKPGPVKNQIANRLNLRRANGETGARGLVDAGPCLAGSMAVRRAQGGRPTTCRTDSAAAFSARGRKLNPGTAETPKHDLCFKIVSKSFLIDQIPASMST